jgi:hypothetical protein
MFDNSFLKNEGMLSKYPYGSFNSLPPEIACNKCVYLDFLGYMTKATQPNGRLCSGIFPWHDHRIL